MDFLSSSCVRAMASVIVVCCVVHLAAATADAQVIRPLTDKKTDGSSGGAIDDAGNVVFALSKTDPIGSNPLHAMQVRQWGVPGGATSQVSHFRRGASDVSVSDDGAWLTVISRSNPTAENCDLSAELFLVSADGATVLQLTNDSALNAGSVLAAKISGSGNRILFSADTDPLGNNPVRQVQLFIVDTDGTHLTQLTSATVFPLGAFDISDDGSRVVFDHTGDLIGQNLDHTSEIFGVLADGTGLFQIPNFSTENNADPVISGDGLKVAFCRDDVEIYTGRWGPVVPDLLGPGRQPSITDDAQFVYYVAGTDEEIFKIPRAGGPATQLTFTSGQLGIHRPQISGANSRIVFSASGGDVMVMDSNGNNMQQLTYNVAYGSDRAPDVTPDGSRVVFLNSWSIFRIQSDGSELTPVQGGGDPSISSDGTMMAFTSSLDLTGVGNNCGGSGYEHIFRVNADGTGLLQLPAAPNCDLLKTPTIASDGSFVVFNSVGGLSRVPTDGSAGSEILNDGNNVNKYPRLSEDSQWVAYGSATDFDGLNPAGNMQVFRARTDGTLIERITADIGFSSFRGDIDADGSRVVYQSQTDPLGTNPDHNWEIFLFDADTASTTQFTATTGGESHDPRISGGGEFVYFVSTAAFFEVVVPERFDLYRATVANGLIERASGLRNTAVGFAPYVNSGNTFLDTDYVVDHDGGAIFSGGFVPTNLNFDENPQMWRVDFDAPARIRPGKQAPTLVSWDVEPHPVRYDVIRGDLADVQPGGAGEIDLGPVVCIEDDSPDNDTLGSEDATQPDPGQTLFYLYRGSAGMLAPTGSYGLSSDGDSRVPAFGNCQP